MTRRISKEENIRARARVLYNKGWRAKDLQEKLHEVQKAIEDGESRRIDPITYDVINCMIKLEQYDLDFLFPSTEIFE